MRPLRALSALFLLLAALAGTFAASPAAAAEDIPRLSGPITDQTGTLAGDESRVERAIVDLRSSTAIDLWVLFVETTNPLSITDYADEVASRNSLGTNDVLLVVAMEDRTDALWVSNSLDDITDSEIDAIISNDLEPRLASGDFAGAIEATASGLARAVGVAVATPSPTRPTATGTPSPTATAGGGATPGTGSGGGGFGIIIPLILLAIGAWIVFAWWRRRNADKRTAEERDKQTGAIAVEANRLLIETDDAIRDARQELGFVEAQFTPSEVEPFRQAIATAANELAAAFTVRQQLDDATPEDPPTRSRMLQEIVDRCKRGRALIDEQMARVEQVRDLERNAPAVIARLKEQLAALDTRLPTVAATLAGLERFAPANRSTVAGNVVEAEKRATAARAALIQGEAVVEKDRTAARTAVQAAQSAMGQATELLDAVDKLAAELNDATAKVAGEIEAAAADIATAQEATRGRQAPLDITGRLVESQRLVEAARRAMAVQPPDVLEARRLAAQAAAAADEALAGVQRDQEVRQRQQATVDRAVAVAGGAVDRAGAYIASRRSGIGREARTRLAEAQRHLEAARALAASDANGATSEARAAEQLAGEAYRLASADFDTWDSQGASPGGYTRGPTGSDIAGSILGGIIGGILSGGRSSGNWGGGGFGGTPWGSSGPFGGSGGGSSRSGGGRSFGGGFGRGGGSSRGGGGRSRGGRW